MTYNVNGWFESGMGSKHLVLTINNTITMNVSELKRERNRLQREHFFYTHHVAIGRGYVAKGKGRMEWYEGRFGKGYKLIWPSETITGHYRRRGCHEEEYLIISYYPTI